MLTVAHYLSETDRGLFVPRLVDTDQAEDRTLAVVYREMANCAVFMVADGRVVGTGFMLKWLDDDDGHGFYYLVTARHVLFPYMAGDDKLDAPDTAERVAVRVRASGWNGDPDPRDVPVRQWYCHPRHPKEADVAITPFTKPKDAGPWLTWPFQVTRSNESVAWEPTALGDQVHFVGMLRHVDEMKERMVPMVRAGTMGAWNQDRVPLEGDTDDETVYARAHLLDANAYKGFSGSPCFMSALYLVDPKRRPSGQAIYHPSGEAPCLIGMIVGHFPEWEPIREAKSKKPMPVETAVNEGVAIVTPFRRIMETLDRGDLMKDREERKQAESKKASRPGRGTRDSVEPSRPGPQPERLQSNETLDELAKRVMDAGKPDEWSE